MSISKLMCSSCPLHGISFNSGETNKMMNAIQFSLQHPGLRPSSIFSFFEDGVLRSIKWLAILPWWKVFSHGLWASSFTWSHLVKFLKKWDLASPSKYLWKHLMNIEWFRNQRHWVWKVCLLFTTTPINLKMIIQNSDHVWSDLIRCCRRPSKKNLFGSRSERRQRRSIYF